MTNTENGPNPDRFEKEFESVIRKFDEMKEEKRKKHSNMMAKRRYWKEMFFGDEVEKE